jgi:hypothetical protein
MGPSRRLRNRKCDVSSLLCDLRALLFKLRASPSVPIPNTSDLEQKLAKDAKKELSCVAGLFLNCFAGETSFIRNSWHYDLNYAQSNSSG